MKTRRLTENTWLTEDSRHNPQIFVAEEATSVEMNFITLVEGCRGIEVIFEKQLARTS